MFTATISRTFVSYIKAIVGAEYILKWLPIGTHDWNKFIKPEELEKILVNQKFSTIDIKGLEFNPLTSKWKKSDNLSVINSLILETITHIQYSRKRRLVMIGSPKSFHLFYLNVIPLVILHIQLRMHYQEFAEDYPHRILRPQSTENYFLHLQLVSNYQNLLRSFCPLYNRA